jgi:proteasome lid subunit RPN8/RPN11
MWPKPCPAYSASSHVFARPRILPSAVLHIPQAIYDQLRRHAERAYPDECCGVLLGVIQNDASLVSAAIEATNASANPRTRYQIAPSELVQIALAGRRDGLEIAGFYHSHPDHPAQWSATDLAEAHWLGCSYLITSAVSGRAETTRAFRLAGSSEDDKRFDNDDLVILP